MLSVRCHPRRRPVGYNVDGVIVMVELSLDAHRLIERFADAPDGLSADGSATERELCSREFIEPSRYTENGDDPLVFLSHVEMYSITADGLDYLAKHPYGKHRRCKVKSGDETQRDNPLVDKFLIPLVIGIVLLVVEYFIIMRLAH